MNSTNCRLIVVNDGSTDSRIGILLNNLNYLKFDNAIEISVIHNERNLGFVSSVNKAIRHSANHIIILNSDTIVPPNWIERLLEPIWRREHEIASVTPMSNSATICSFPEFCERNDLFKNLSAEQIDWYFKKYGGREPFEIPTAVGFCMALNRRVLNKIGFLDEESFGRGYGEENDWSMRARKAGFKNVMTTNLFVYHRDGGSFSADEKLWLLHENIKKVERKHRGYNRLISAFIQADPAKDIRDTLAILIDRHTETKKNLVVILDHGLGGGANIYSRFIAETLREKGFGLVLVRFHFHENYFSLQYETENLERKINMRAIDKHLVVSVLAFLAPSFIIVNSVVSWPDPLEVCLRIKDLGIPYLVFIHDFFYLCPNWNLIDNEGSFCGLPENNQKCLGCASTNTLMDFYKVYEHRYSNLITWRSTMADFLKNAFAITFFSKNTMELFNRVYSFHENCCLVEHALYGKSSIYQRRLRSAASGVFTIGVIGSIRVHKGFKIIEQLIASQELKRLNARIVIIGQTLKYRPGCQYHSGTLYVHGEYCEEELPGLLESYGVSLVMIPSIWPETFSFTTSEALILGYPVICFDIGAPADRIRQYECGIVIDCFRLDKLTEGLRRVIDNPELLVWLSENTQRYKPMLREQHGDIIVNLVEKGIGSRPKKFLPREEDALF